MAVFAIAFSFGVLARPVMGTVAPIVMSVVVFSGDAVECATCGAGGRLAVEDGAAVVRFDEPARLERSVISLAEKRG